MGPRPDRRASLLCVTAVRSVIEWLIRRALLRIVIGTEPV